MSSLFYVSTCRTSTRRDGSTSCDLHGLRVAWRYCVVTTRSIYTDLDSFVISFLPKFSVPPSKAVMFESFLPVLLRWWPSALLILGAAAYFVNNHFKHGLNRYPGPFLASLTDWWRFCIVYGRRPEVTHIRLHRKHGDVVRLGPSVLSFASPAAIKDIYGLKKGFKKVADDISPGYRGASSFVDQ